VKLRYTPRAITELDELLAYIEQHSPRGARHVKTRIRSVINFLSQHPHAGRLTSKGGLRRVVAYPYAFLIFYSASEDEVVIHGVRHGARRPASMPNR
jgi:plasmid stabilization system protein ParE